MSSRQWPVLGRSNCWAKISIKAQFTALFRPFLSLITDKWIQRSLPEPDNYLPPVSSDLVWSPLSSCTRYLQLLALQHFATFPIPTWHTQVNKHNGIRERIWGLKESEELNRKRSKGGKLRMFWKVPNFAFQTHPVVDLKMSIQTLPLLQPLSFLPPS